jgi:hypothetical protein
MKSLHGSRELEPICAVSNLFYDGKGAEPLVGKFS